MNVTRLAMSLLLLQAVFLHAQTVSTLVGPSANIDDGLALDKQGNLYGSNFDGSAIFKVTKSGQQSVFSDGFVTPNGLVFDSAGNLYLADHQASRIYKIDSTGASSPYGPSIVRPSGVLFDPDSDTLYVSQYTTNTIIKLTPDGASTVFSRAGGLNGPVGMTFDDAKNLYVGNFNNSTIYKITPDGTASLFAALPCSHQSPWLGFITYSNGIIYGTSFNCHLVYRISASGDVSVFAGTGQAGSSDGPALSATFNGPNGILPNPAGDTLYVSDYNTKSVRIITDFVTRVEPNETVKIPQEFQLRQNYPNPFNPDTKIPYSLAKSGRVSLTIYNALGTTIVTLVDDHQMAGIHTATFTAENLPSGVYFYKLDLQSGNSQMKKMLLIK